MYLNSDGILGHAGVFFEKIDLNAKSFPRYAASIPNFPVNKSHVGRGRQEYNLCT